MSVLDSEESLSAQLPVAGSSRSRTLDVSALANPPETLAIYSNDVHAFFAAALDRTGASIEELQPHLNNLVDTISVELLAARDKAEYLGYYLLALDEVVSVRLAGSALAEWSRRTRKAGGDVVDDEVEDEAGVSTSAGKGKGKAVEEPAGERWKDKQREMRENFAKSVADADKICLLYTPYGSFAKFPRGNAMSVNALCAQRDWTTVLRWLCHIGPRGKQLEPTPPHDKVEELVSILTKRAEQEMMRNMRGGRYGPHHLKKAKKWMTAKWSDELRWGPDPLPPPPADADGLGAPPPSAASAQGPAPSTSTAAAPSPSPSPATSPRLAADSSDDEPQHAAAPAPRAKPSGVQAKAQALTKKSCGRAPLQPRPAAAAVSPTSSGDERDSSSSEDAQEEQRGDEDDAALKSGHGRTASRGAGRAPRRVAAAAASPTSSDDERDGWSSEAEQVEQHGDEAGAALKSGHGRTASRGAGRAPRRVAAAAASPTSSDDERDGSSSGSAAEDERAGEDGKLAAAKAAPGRAVVAAGSHTTMSARAPGRAAEPGSPRLGSLLLGGFPSRGAPRASREVVLRASRAGNGVDTSGTRRGDGNKIGDPSSAGKVGEPSRARNVPDGNDDDWSAFLKDQGFLKMPRVPGWANSKPEAPYLINPPPRNYVRIPRWTDPRSLDIGRFQADLAELPPKVLADIQHVVERIAPLSSDSARARLRLPSLSEQISLTEGATRSELLRLLMTTQAQAVFLLDTLLGTQQYYLEERLLAAQRDADHRGLRWAQGLRTPIHNGYGVIMAWEDRDGVVYDVEEGGAPSRSPYFNGGAPSSESDDKADELRLLRRTAPWFVSDDEDDEDDDPSIESGANQSLNQDDEASVEQDVDDEVSIKSIVSDSLARDASSGTGGDDDDDDEDPFDLVADSQDVAKNSVELDDAASSGSEHDDKQAVEVASSVASDEEGEESEVSEVGTSTGSAAEEVDEEVREDARSRRRARSRILAAPLVAARDIATSEAEDDDNDGADESSLLRERDGWRWSDEDEA